jgi:SAM-dependent methyltransferase
LEKIDLLKRMGHAIGLVRPSKAVVERKPDGNGGHNTEVNHWNEIENRANAGERLFWLNHPRVAQRYFEKSLVDGLLWRDWIIRQFNGPADTALELGCGNGAALVETMKVGVAKAGVGIDLDDSRFQADTGTVGTSLQFVAADLNQVEIEPNRYDLIYALHSFHHFEALEHIMEQVTRGLTDRGYFILEEYVGPARFQWTDLQLALTSQLLGIMPKPLRWYANGIEKRAEGRSTPEEVIQVCPSEAIRSDEIVPLFLKYFEPVHHKKLGGTIQHLLYSGIVHNFPDNDADIDRLVDCIDGIETKMIDLGALPSDFVLLIGKRR